MATRSHPNEPLPLNKAARCLRVPAGWMRDEVDAGRLPALHAGRAILVHIPTIAKLLTDRARTGDAQAVRRD